jgi:hypothetical protein
MQSIPLKWQKFPVGVRSCGTGPLERMREFAIGGQQDIYCRLLNGTVALRYCGPFQVLMVVVFAVQT